MEKAQEIINKLNKIFGLKYEIKVSPLREGRNNGEYREPMITRKRVDGEWKNVVVSIARIWIKDEKDVDTICHEFAHHLAFCESEKTGKFFQKGHIKNFYSACINVYEAMKNELNLDLYVMFQSHGKISEVGQRMLRAYYKK